MSKKLENTYSFWDKWLFKQVDNSALVVFRVLYGLLLASEAFGSMITGWMKRQFIDPEFTFTFIGFEFLEPLPGNWMYAVFALMGVAGLMVMVGYKYRLAIFTYALLWTYVYLLQKSSYNNHYYLLMLFNWVMVFLPADRWGSIDAWRKPWFRKTSMPRWIYVFIIALLWIVYSYASIAKFYPDWLDGSFTRYLMAHRNIFPWLKPHLQHEWVADTLLYFGLFFDLLIVPLLLWRKTRLAAIIASFLFHLSNSLIFQIGIFPYLALAFLVFFIDSRKIHKSVLWRKPYYQGAEIVVPRYKLPLISVMSIFLLIMLLLPLRHWIIKDDVLWTEEGHRLSWRMMLRSRSGYAVFFVEDKDTGERKRVKLNEHLSSKQKRSVSSKPDFMWQFAQYLEKKYEEKGQDIAVYVHARISINGRRSVQFIDPEVDLAAEEWDHFGHHDWILPSNLERQEEGR